MSKTPATSPSFAALRKDYKRQIMREFMGGTSTRALCNKHSLTKGVVEQIIRNQMIGVSERPN